MSHAQMKKIEDNNFFMESFHKADKKELLKKLISEATRIDGDALWCRRNRPESWEETTRHLSNEIHENISPFDFGRLFQRLDATYPSLHANITLPDELDYRKETKKKRLPIEFEAEVHSIDGNDTIFVITEVDKSFPWKADFKPQIRDQITSINGRDIESWREENFIFCKFALKIQCDTRLSDRLKSGLLSVNILKEKSINFGLKRGAKLGSIVVPIMDGSRDLKNDDKKHSCSDLEKIYSDYKLVFGEGKNVCLFEKKNSPEIALMRIISFVAVENEKGEIFGPKEEAKLLFPFWKKVSSKYKHLIIDVSDNHGGDVPAPITALILDKPFQDLWVQFKKTKEFGNTDFRSQDLIFGRMVEKAFVDLGVWKHWDKIKYGDFLPPIPQFCVDDGKDCLKDRYQLATHSFSGKVSVIVNQWCVSSCSGFVWTLKNHLPSDRIKFVGFPDSADTTYERYRINVYFSHLQKSGFEISIQPDRYRPNNARSMLALTWRVSATRSTDQNGKMMSMLPIILDRFVPWHSDKNRWIQEAIKVAEEEKN
jgi:hypothetical protein